MRPRHRTYGGRTGEIRRSGKAGARTCLTLDCATDDILGAKRPHGSAINRRENASLLRVGDYVLDAFVSFRAACM